MQSLPVSCCDTAAPSTPLHKQWVMPPQCCKQSSRVLLSPQKTSVGTFGTAGTSQLNCNSRMYHCILVVLLTCKILQFARHNQTSSKLRISPLLHSLSFALDLISGCSTNRCRRMHFQTELWVCLYQAALFRAETLKWHVYF